MTATDRADEPETYGLTWPGKAAARAEAATSATGGLEPGPDDDPGAPHLFVEGDNLQALKLLAPELAGSVDLIYIDPPYNTGNQFAYSDARTEAGWLSMMWPRLAVAVDALAPHGVGMVSIDANQCAQLMLLLQELVGPSNVFATIAWVSNLKGRQIGRGGPVGTHEYIVCFAKDATLVPRFRADAAALHALMPALYRHIPREVRRDATGEYVLKNQLYNTNSKFNELTAPTMVFRIHYHPDTGDIRITDVDDPATFDGYLVADPHPNARPEARWHAWRWSRQRILTDRDDLEFEVRELPGGRGPELRIWTKVRDTTGMALKDVVLGPSTVTGQRDLADLGLERTFDTPKPVALLRLLIEAAAPADATILDFFAGSGSTGQAVAEANAADGGTRRAILIQNAEPTPQDGAARAAGLHTIADVARERLTRAGVPFRSWRVAP